MYNKRISDFTKKYLDENGNTYFELTIQEMQDFFNVSENTARKYKNELVNKNLILEMPSNGQMATRYAINEDLDLHKDSFTYVNQNGEKRFTFIKIPRFLQHSHFNGCKNYKYQVLCIKTDCFTS